MIRHAARILRILEGFAKPVTLIPPLKKPVTKVTKEVDPDEVGSTIEENSAIKAREYGKYVGNVLVSNIKKKSSYSESEIRKYIEKRVREELKKKFIYDARKLREKIGVESSIPSYKLIREDREHEH